MHKVCFRRVCGFWGCAGRLILDCSWSILKYSRHLKRWDQLNFYNEKRVVEKNKRRKGWRRQSTAENSWNFTRSSIKGLSFAFVVLSFTLPVSRWKRLEANSPKVKAGIFAGNNIHFKIISIIVIIISSLLSIVMLIYIPIKNYQSTAFEEYVEEKMQRKHSPNISSLSCRLPF